MRTATREDVKENAPPGPMRRVLCSFCSSSSCASSHLTSTPARTGMRTPILPSSSSSTVGASGSDSLLAGSRQS